MSRHIGKSSGSSRAVINTACLDHSESHRASTGAQKARKTAAASASLWLPNRENNCPKGSAYNFTTPEWGTLKSWPPAMHAINKHLEFRFSCLRTVLHMRSLWTKSRRSVKFCVASWIFLNWKPINSPVRPPLDAARSLSAWDSLRLARHILYAV